MKTVNENTKNVKVRVIGFEGPNRVGKGTQIEQLSQYLDSKSVPFVVLRGAGSRPASGAHAGDPLSPWWSQMNELLRTVGTLEMWQTTAVRLAREFVLWRDHYFPKILRERGATEGVLIVDRTILSQAMILLESGVLDWHKLYPNDAMCIGKSITGDLVCPDIIINLVASREVLLSRLDPTDPKHAFRKRLIETKSTWFADVPLLLPHEIQRKIHTINAVESINRVFEHVRKILEPNLSWLGDP